jgi:phosphate starvation-inducible protein PhoH
MTKPKRTEKTISLKRISPLTDTQKDAFHFFSQGKNLILHGSAGTGKTFISTSLILGSIFSQKSTPKKLIILRSCVPTREIGFLPGSLQEKLEVYETPYIEIVNDLCNNANAYTNLKTNGTIEFHSTSFLRGLTFENSYILVDEFQNMSFQEIDSVITRLGEGSVIVFCGDTNQCDFNVAGKKKEQSGFERFMKIASMMNDFCSLEFLSSDIVRSGIVARWIIEKENNVL